MSRNTKQSGQAMLMMVFFFLTGMLVVTVGITGPVLRDVQAMHETAHSHRSFYLAESLLEDIAYRASRFMLVPPFPTLTIDGEMAQGTTTVSAGVTEIIVDGDYAKAVRKNYLKVVVGSGASFNFGVQAGAGGFLLENSSSVLGNVYSDGPIVGSGLNDIVGTAVSATTTGLIEDVHVAEDARAHTITDALVDGDAYYQVISGTTVSGTEYPGTPDLATSTLPIPDALVEEWKATAQAGGSISSPCPYKITSNTTIGPVMITCDLEISSSPTVTLSGVVWVKGNITFKNSPELRIDVALGTQSIPMIADNPTDRITSSKITIQNSASFFGSGSGSSYVLLLSQNESAERGGDEKAIEASNSVNGDVLVYAGHGEVLIHNNIEVREVTAYRVHAKNSAQIVYESGLASLVFPSGPSGGFEFDGWSEI